jgi:2-C-methyl-D-erythritol 4-phosphate cytidylyltransferase
MPRYALIVAGGSGTRMGSSVPKQFLPLAGRPVLMHTLQRFHETDPDIQLILVLPDGAAAAWQALCTRHAFDIPHRVVAGGSSRTASVRQGLAAVPPGAIVAVHDGVRPLVSHALIRRCFEAAAGQGTAVPVLPVSESLRRLEGDGSTPVDRGAYRLVQTPQCFRAAVLQDAYARAGDTEATDDATIAEAAGASIHLVEGEPENIKLTTPADLAVAESILRRQESRADAGL